MFDRCDYCGDGVEALEIITSWFNHYFISYIADSEIYKGVNEILILAILSGVSVSYQDTLPLCKGNNTNMIRELRLI